MPPIPVAPESLWSTSAPRRALRAIVGIAGGSAIVALAASSGLVGCSDPPKPTPAVTETTAQAAAAASAAAAKKTTSDRKQKIEALVTELVSSKGIVAKSVTCPDDAADHFTVKCPIVTGQGEKIVAECRGDSDRPSCKLDAAIVDATKVAGLIRTELAKKKKPKAEVSCPEGPLVKAVGDRFYCKAIAKKKTIPIDVTVTDLDGRVKVAFKT